MTRRSVAALAGVGALVALGGWWFGGSPRSGGGPPGAPAAAPGRAPDPTAGIAPASGAAGMDPGPLPESLRGTDPAGGLSLGPDGHFAPGPDALALFDYYYAAAGEEPEAQIRARILAEIRRLPSEAAAEAAAFFARYLAYRDAARELFQADLSFLDEERRVQRVRELRREVFGAELAAQLFGAEEEIVRIDLERRRLAQDASLPAEERQRRLAALEEQLPETERLARAEARAVLALRDSEAALRAAGADAAAIHAERERRFGPEAAERLDALDARRAAWDARVAAYRAERDALRAQLAPEDAAEALAGLRDAHFEGPERVRIEMLDRLEAADGASEPSAANAP